MAEHTIEITMNNEKVHVGGTINLPFMPFHWIDRGGSSEDGERSSKFSLLRGKQGLHATCKGIFRIERCIACIETELHHKNFWIFTAIEETG